MNVIKKVFSMQFEIIMAAIVILKLIGPIMRFWKFKKGKTSNCFHWGTAYSSWFVISFLLILQVTE